MFALALATVPSNSQIATNEDNDEIIKLFKAKNGMIAYIYDSFAASSCLTLVILRSVLLSEKFSTNKPEISKYCYTISFSTVAVLIQK